MSEVTRWVVELATEVGRELGQAVTGEAGGSAPERADSLVDRLEVRGARLVLAASRSELSKFLVEARLMDAGQADGATVEELWRGILSSVAGRLGGSAAPAEQDAVFPSDPCFLRLGGAILPMVLAATADRASAAAPGAAGGNFDLLLEVELDAAVRFGSSELELRDLLELGPGDVVELDRHLADPVDLIVGDKIVARGEVVLVNGNFGLRVTEVAEPMRRLESVRWQ
ncbi:MAG TPA: FliM/FliN family flagellar motor switch protein [Acidobacteriaceae bacterium]